jgi:prepilin-type N-terminal cleavage/methylation domain-containing protein
MKNRHSHGFTLVELLTAIVIAVVIASAIYETLSIGLKSKKKGVDISEKNQIARVIFDNLRADLLSCSVSSTTPSWSFSGTMVSSGSTYQDTLQFVTLNQSVDWNTTAQSDESFVKYAIDTTPTNNKVGLIRIINRHVTDPDSTDLDYQFISGDVVSLHFQYYDGSSWLEEWMTDTTILPKMVSITMAVKDPNSVEGIEWYSTWIRLPKA